MKIGIVTHYDLFNYGSYLQAYAMQQQLAELGHEPRFIRLKSLQRQLRRYRQLNWWPRAWAFNWKLRRAFAAAWRGLDIDDGPGHRYDAVVVGSDELWNVRNRKIHLAPEFFGIGLDSPNVLAYAPTAGRSTCADIAAIPGALEGLRRMSRLAARDDGTSALIEEATGHRPPKLLDPALLMDWRGCEVDPGVGRCLLVYAYQVDKDMQACVLDFARRRRLRVVVPCFYNRWGDYRLPFGPFEFLGLMRRASFVVTDTFHGIVFSTLYRRRFAVLPNGKLKVLGLLKDLQLGDRMLAGAGDLENVLESGPDWVRTFRILDEGRRRSLEFLREALDNREVAASRPQREEAEQFPGHPVHAASLRS